MLQQIDRVEASRSAMGRTRSLMLYRMHRLLTADQRVKLKALYEAVEREKSQHAGRATEVELLRTRSRVFSQRITTRDGWKLLSYGWGRSP